MKNIRRILLFYHSELAEIFSALSLLLLGIWIVNPYVETFQSSVSYFIMRTFPFPESRINEAFWGVLFIVFAATHLYGIVYERGSIRKLSLYFSFFIWTVLSSMFLYSNPAAFGGAQFALLAIFNGYIIGRGK